jgi:hypothetical protein
MKKLILVIVMIMTLSACSINIDTLETDEATVVSSFNKTKCEYTREITYKETPQFNSKTTYFCDHVIVKDDITTYYFEDRQITYNNETKEWSD